MYGNAAPVTGTPSSIYVIRQRDVSANGTCLDAKGKREAQIECARLISELDGGTYMEPSKTTMAQYLERWLDSHKIASLTANPFAILSDNPKQPRAVDW